MAQYQASAVAVRENVARLRALRLANQDRQTKPFQIEPRLPGGAVKTASGLEVDRQAAQPIKVVVVDAQRTSGRRRCDPHCSPLCKDRLE